MYCTYFYDVDLSADVYKDMLTIDTSKLYSTDLHKIFNENLAFKYIYDNHLYDSEYIGVCSYRRIVPVESIDIDTLTVDTCLMFETMFGRQDNNTFGLFWWSKDYWYNCKFIYNEWLEYCYDYNLTWALETDLLTAKKKIFYNRNCFVMHRDKFKGLVDYNWNFATYLNDKHNLQWNTENYIKWIQKNYVDTHLCDSARHNMKSYPNYIRLIAYLIEIMNHHFIMYNFNEEHIKIMHTTFV